MMNTGAAPMASTHGLLTTVGYQLGPGAPPVYALEGAVMVCGSLVQVALPLGRGGGGVEVGGGQEGGRQERLNPPRGAWAET